MHVTELQQQLVVAAQHGAQEETVTVLTAARQKTQQGETEARLLSLHQATQDFPHSLNQPERARTTDSGSALTLSSRTTQLNPKYQPGTQRQLVTGSLPQELGGGTQRGGQECYALSRRTNASLKNCIHTALGGQLGCHIFTQEGSERVAEPLRHKLPKT